MKAVTLFVSGAVASTLAPRAEIDTMRNDIATIREQVHDFTDTLNDYNEDDFDALRADLKDMILAINAADSDTKTLKGPFSDKDATELATPIQDLGIDIGKAMDALISKKSALVAKCHGGEVYQALVDQNMQSLAFQKDLMKYLSKNVQTLAQQMAKPVNANIARGVAAFSDQQMAKCTPPKPATTSSIYGAVVAPTGAAKPQGSSSNSNSNSNSNSSPSSSNNQASTSNNQASTSNNNVVGSNNAVSQSGTSSSSSNTTISSGSSPTGTIVKGSASTFGVSLSIALVAGIAIFAL